MSRNRRIEGTVVRVAVSGVEDGEVLGLVESVLGLLRVECKRGGAQIASTCDAISSPE